MPPRALDARPPVSLRGLALLLCLPAAACNGPVLDLGVTGVDARIAYDTDGGPDEESDDGATPDGSSADAGANTSRDAGRDAAIAMREDAGGSGSTDAGGLEAGSLDANVIEGGTGDGGALECTSDDECVTPAKSRCETSLRRCVQCLTSADCGGLRCEPNEWHCENHT